MVNFRRVIMAFAVLTLFAGLVSAQVDPTSAQLNCATNVGVTPAMRGEGYTEMTGDVSIVCTGGVTPVVGNPIGLVNFTIYYNSTVTSRLIGTGGTSEALLLIDEPGSGLTGKGPLRPQKLCLTPLSGCAANVGIDTTGTGPATFRAVEPVGGADAPNVYQGIVSGNSVTFLGVPVLAPTSIASRVFRITNVRVNGTTSPSQVQASISITPASALQITQPVTNVGFVNPSLTVSADKITSLNQCESKTRIAASTLTFTERFASAFKTRIYAQTDAEFAGQTGLTVPGAAYGTTTLATSQSVPGSVTNSNSESNFVFPIGTAFAGLADYGTRLKATFTNVPSGVRIFVSQSNVNNASTALSPVPATGHIGGSVANTIGTYAPYARLVISDSVVDNNGGTTLGALDTTTPAAAPGTTGAVNATEVLIANGVGSATWEILNTSPTTVDTYKFGVYISYTSNITNNFPPPGDSVSVNLTYAPTATSGVATTGVLPRFAADANATTLLNVGICKTVLLYPFVTNQAGFDTGFAIANTTQDPFAIAAQKGTCRLNWYGDPKTVPFSDWPVIDAGTVHADVLSVMNPGFQGYAIAVCNFQYAHGYASIFNNFGAANGVFSSYLAVVLNDPRSNTNTFTNENGAH